VASLSDLGEFGYIARVTRNLPTGADVVVGPGDDCAVVRQGGKLMLVSCDASIEDVHFSRALAQPYDIGWKTFASAFSDIAAMGGVAKYAVASMACPPDTPLDVLDEISQGAHDCVAACGAVLIGGDTTRSPGPIMLDVTVIGEAEEGGYRLRSGAKPGDIVAHTGVLGLSAAGLLSLQQGIPALDLARAHLHPEPRLAAGHWLAQRAEVHAMMDISDGLAQDASHIARASKLAIRIDAHEIDVSGLEAWEETLGASALDLATSGGEDYELLVTIDAAAFAALRKEFEQAHNLPLTPVGRCIAGNPEVHIEGHESQRGGFDHFR
jgi:thiamine-monophosphate kinase